MPTSSSQRVPLTPSSDPPPDSIPTGLFEPIPRWELGYGNAGATEHWVDHPADVEPWSVTDAPVAVPTPSVESAPSTWWQRFSHWLTH